MSQPNLVFDFSNMLSKAMINQGHNLVLKQVVVHRKDGTTFTRNQLVDPSQPLPVQSIAAGFDINKFNTLKSDKTSALKYLKDNGVYWNEDDLPGVNWMRACMAAKSAAGIASAPRQTKVAPAASNSSPVPAIAPAAQPVQSIKAVKRYNLNGLTGYDSKDSKSKSIMIKTVIDKDDMLSFAKAAGVTWNENAIPGVNYMRMSMALSKWADTHSLSDAQMAASTMSNVPTLVKPDVIPIIPKATKPIIKPTEKKREDNLLDVSSETTPDRQKIAELINGIQTIEDYDIYKSAGIIAEDDDSKLYLKNILIPKSAEQTSSHTSRGSSYGVNESINGAIKKSLKGITTKMFKHGINDAYMATLNSVQFTSPRSMLGMPNLDSDAADYIRSSGTYNRAPSSESEVLVTDVIEAAQRGFGIYSDDIQPGFNQGLLSPKLSERASQFNPGKDGFCRMLDIITDKEPGVKAEADKMKHKYFDLMKSTGYLLSDKRLGNETQKSILTMRESDVASEVEVIQTDINKSEEVKIALRKLLSKEDAELVINDLEKSTYKYLNLSEVPQSVYVTNPNYDPSKGYSYNNSDNPRNKKITFDLNTVNTTTGEPFRNAFMANYYSVYSQETIDQMKEKINSKVYTVDNKKRCTEIAKSMFGLKESDLTPTPYNSNSLDKRLEPDRDNPELDTILSNIFRMQDVVETRSRVCNTLEHNYMMSAANDNGHNLENIVNFVNTSHTYSTGDKLNGEKLCLYPDSSKEYSAKEYTDMIKKQTEEIPVVSLNKCKKMKQELIDFNKDRSDKIPSYLKGNPNGETRFELVGGRATGLSVWYNSSDNEENNTPSSHPLCDLMVENLSDLAVHNPFARNTRLKTDDQVRQTLLRNLGLSAATSDADDSFDGKITKQLRKSLMDKIKCSISKLPDDQYTELQHKIKEDWDQRVHGRSSATFYGAYTINNLAVTNEFKAESVRIGETPQEYYHGTSFGGTKGILGQTGGFRVATGNQVVAGSMLGNGVYLAKKSSKSAQYFKGYNYGRFGRGSLVICDAIMGNKALYNNIDWRNSSYDTVEASDQSGSRSGLLNDEWAVRHANWVNPKILVDMENTLRHD